MIDTLGFKILIDADSLDRLSAEMTRTQRVDRKTGFIHFEYHNSRLEFASPSWQYAVTFRTSDEMWGYHAPTKRTYKEQGHPHVVMEYSVPKVLIGNNIESVDPCLIFASMHTVRECFEGLYGIALPSPNEWYCYRVDTCANYVMASAEEVKSVIAYLQRLNYPRKIKNSYEDSGLYYASRHQTLKVYWKGPEFKKHDRERCVNDVEAYNYLCLAQRILRFEVEHKKRLRYVVQTYEQLQGRTLDKFEGYPRMRDLIEIFDCREEHDRVVSKMLCGTEPKIMRSSDVYNLLLSKVSDRQARSFHHVYMVIVTQGQKEAKKIVREGTYYRATRAFRELGITVIVSDGEEEGVFLERGFPADFSLEMSEGNPFYQKPLCECPGVHYRGEVPF